VRAELETQTYEEVRYPFTVNYDVVVTVTTIPQKGGGAPCNNDSDPDGAFGEVRDRYIKVCTNPPTANPSSNECKDYTICVPGDPCYEKNCYNNQDRPGVDTCAEMAKTQSGCGQGGEYGPTCEVKPGVVFRGKEFTKVYTSEGCASISSSSRGLQLPGKGSNGSSKEPITYMYTWTTAIRIVGLGTNYN